MTTTTTEPRPTFIAPPGAVCGAYAEPCQGEAVTTYAAPGVESVYLHADAARCLVLAWRRWREEEGD